MTIRKRNDAQGYKRGGGAYTSHNPGLNKVTLMQRKASVEPSQNADSAKKGGFASRLDKK